MRRPSSSTIAGAVICAVGFAVAGSIFCLAHAIVLRPLPYHHPSTLAWVWATRVDRDRAFFSLPDFRYARQDVSEVATLVAVANWGANLTGGTEPRRVQGIRATGNITDVLGIHPRLGRGLTSADDRPGAAAVVMISDALWRAQFGSRADIIGRSILLNEAPYTVIGVLPAHFLVPGSEVDVMTPLRADADPRRDDPETNFIRVMARVADERQLVDLGTRLAGTVARLKAIYPAANAKKTAPRVVPIAAEVFGAYRGTVALLALCGGLIVLLSAANLAHLLLARVSATTRDAAIRLALGGSRLRVAVAVARTPFAVGGVAGIAAFVMMTIAVPIIGSRLPGVPRAADARVDATAGLTIAGIALFCACLASAVVLSQVLRRHALASALSGRRATERSRAGRQLVVAEVALSLTLLTAALLALDALRASLRIDTGVHAEQAATVRLSLPARYADRHRLDALLRGILDSIRGDGDVTSAGATNVLPLSGMNVRTDFVIEGRAPRSALEVPAAQNRWLSGDYFEAAGIPIVRGRALTQHDDEHAEPVVVIDAALARQYWKDRDPIGDRIRFVGTGAERPWRIVGVAGSIKHQSLDEPPTGTLYAPIAQAPDAALPFIVNSLTLIVRTRAGAQNSVEGVLRGAVHGRDSTIPVGSVRPMSDLTRAAVAPRAVTAALMSALALTSLVTGAFGIAAVTAAVVAARRREFAIRLAVGASPARLCSAVLRETIVLTATGAVLGVIGGTALIAVSGPLAATATGARVTSATIAALLIGLMTLLAALVPAWRAGRLDPAVVLRQD